MGPVGEICAVRLAAFVWTQAKEAGGGQCQGSWGV